MESEKTTLEVRKRTKDRINQVKGPLTADELVNLALDALPPDRVIRVFEEWQNRALEALRGTDKSRASFRWPLRKKPPEAQEAPVPELGPKDRPRFPRLRRPKASAGPTEKKPPESGA